MIINIPMFVTMVIWRKSSIEVLTNIKPHCGLSGGINVDACTHCSYLFFIIIKEYVRRVHEANEVMGIYPKALCTCDTRMFISSWVMAAMRCSFVTVPTLTMAGC